MGNKILTEEQLVLFWIKNSVPNPKKPLEGVLTTSGLRKLLLSCFKPDDSDIWIKLAKGYTGKPPYPFLHQPDIIKNHIIGMLESHPEGKKFIDDYINKVAKKIAQMIIQEYSEQNKRMIHE